MVDISIITVVFNAIENGRKETLIQAIDSVACQSHNAFEHIIIDGASTDGTVELLEELKTQGKISHYISEPDKGIYDAMNKGVSYAKGKYIGFLNSDDYYCDDNVFKIISEHIQGYDYCYSSTILLNEMTDQKIGIAKPDLKRFLTKIPFGHQSFFMRRDHFCALEGFDINFKIIADYDLVMRYFLSHIKPKGLNIYKNFICYRMGGASDNNQKNKSEKIKLWQKNFGEADYEKYIEQKILPLKILINLLKKHPRHYIAIFLEIFRTMRKG